MNASTVRPARRLRWWQALLLGLAALAALFAVLAALVLASLFGVFESLGGDPPREGDPEVVAARQDSAAALQQEVALVTESAVLPALPPGSALLAEVEVTPPCQEGQHNWKIDDDFDLACSQSRREVVSVPDRTSFRADMLQLDQALRANGWHPAFQPVPDVLTGYWDTLAGEPWPGGSDGSAYSMADMPPAGYSRAVGGRSRSLSVSWVERDSRGTDLTSYVSSARLTMGGEQVAPDEVVEAVPADGYALVVSVGEEYFDK